MNEESLNFIAEILSEEEATAGALPDTKSTWIKFIFTDDGPNANKQGVHKEEFDNLITTGVHKPVKKFIGSLKDHKGAIPIGAIAKLEPDGDRILGIANIWDTEYPDEANWIRDSHSKGDKLNVSWEILYKSSEVDEDGVHWLKDCITKAITLVDSPAYGGRTHILAVAAKWSPPYLEQLPDEAFILTEERLFPYKDSDGKIDPKQLEDIIEKAPQSNLPNLVIASVVKKAENILYGRGNMEELQTKVENLTAENARLTEKVRQLEVSNAESSDAVGALGDALTELESLRAFKANIETQAAIAAQADSRAQKLSEAGITITKEDLISEKWANVDDATFDLILSVLGLIKQPEESTASTQKKVFPTTTSTTQASDSVSKLRQMMEERRNPKKDDK